MKRTWNKKEFRRVVEHFYDRPHLKKKVKLITKAINLAKRPVAVKEKEVEEMVRRIQADREKKNKVANNATPKFVLSAEQISTDTLSGKTAPSE